MKLIYEQEDQLTDWELISETSISFIEIPLTGNW
jgi:hypothetical protein